MSDRLDLNPRPEPGRSDRPAVLVLPGGGYTHLADHEAEPVADWLGTLGHDGYVLRYPVGAEDVHPAQLDAARAAMRLLRARHRRVGVLGFSAGGHLAGMLSAAKEVPAGERPDFAVLCYPALSWQSFGPSEESAVDPLLGPEPDPALRRAVSYEEFAAADAPPTFLWHCADDEVVPVRHALLGTATLAALGVPVELHVLPAGGHGKGLAAEHPEASRWTALCAEWLRGLDAR
jgi:acetyl esterase/lipase